MTLFRYQDRQRWQISPDSYKLSAAEYEQYLQAHELLKSANGIWQQAEDEAKASLEKWQQQGIAEARQQHFEQLLSSATRQYQQLTELIDRNQQAVLALCEKILLTTLPKLDHRQLLTAMLQQAFEEIHGNQWLTVKVAADNYALATEVITSLEQSHVLPLHIKVVSDPQLGSWECRLESDLGCLYFDLQADIEQCCQHPAEATDD